MTSSWLAGTATFGFRLFGYTFGREQWGWRPWPRVLALQATLILYFLALALVTTLDGHSESGSPSTIVGRLSYLLVLLMWASVPLAPGLAHQAWRRLRPI